MAKQLTQDEVQLVKDVVDELTTKDYQFTAYDVTKLVRGTTNERTPHWQVKSVVHDMFNDGEMGGYSQRLTTVPGTNAQAFLYYDPSSNQGDYDPDLVPDLHIDYNPSDDDTEEDDDDDDTSGSCQPSQTAAVAMTPTPVDTNTQRHISRDGRGRLCIPVDFAKQIGACPGDAVIVWPNTNQDAVHIYRPVSTRFTKRNEDKVYHVDRNGNIRINSAVLSFLGAGSLQCVVDPTCVLHATNKRIIITG